MIGPHFVRGAEPADPRFARGIRSDPRGRAPETVPVQLLEYVITLG